MKISAEELRSKISAKGLKVTPQRLAILEAIVVLNNHPTAENVIKFIRTEHPNIATGTVYKVLESLVDNRLIQKVKTEKDIMRYDAVMEKHHHLYCSTCNTIEDYTDEELDKLLHEHFAKKKINGFTVEDIVLQIKGSFKKC